MKKESADDGGAREKGGGKRDQAFRKKNAEYERRACVDSGRTLTESIDPL